MFNRCQGGVGGVVILTGSLASVVRQAITDTCAPHALEVFDSVSRKDPVHKLQTDTVKNGAPTYQIATTNQAPSDYSPQPLAGYDA